MLAVTGTDGKSTTTAWLGEIARAAGPAGVGGNIGIPLCEAVDRLEPGAVVIAEISCFQLTNSPELHPKVAIFTNLAPDHLNYYAGSVTSYYAAKKRLMANLEAGETAVLNHGDPVLRTWRAPEPARSLWYAQQALPADRDGLWVEDGVIRSADGPLIETRALPLPGGHNVENAMAAALGARAYGIDDDAIRTGLLGFSGLQHRIQHVVTTDGIAWYNDSKATNPHAAEAALRAFDERIVLLAGGSEKDAEWADWADLVVERTRHVILFGETAAKLDAALSNRVAVSRVQDLEAAIAEARRVTRKGIVVLSPACASFDQFDNFEHRGEVFEALVRTL